MSKTMCAICYVNMYGNIQFPQDFCVIFICVFIKKYAIFFSASWRICVTPKWLYFQTTFIQFIWQKIRHAHIIPLLCTVSLQSKMSPAINICLTLIARFYQRPFHDFLFGRGDVLSFVLVWHSEVGAAMQRRPVPVPRTVLGLLSSAEKAFF